MNKQAILMEMWKAKCENKRFCGFSDKKWIYKNLKQPFFLAKNGEIYTKNVFLVTFIRDLYKKLQNLRKNASCIPDKNDYTFTRIFEKGS